MEGTRALDSGGHTVVESRFPAGAVGAARGGIKPGSWGVEGRRMVARRYIWVEEREDR